MKPSPNPNPSIGLELNDLHLPADAEVHRTLIKQIALQAGEAGGEIEQIARIQEIHGR